MKQKRMLALSVRQPYAEMILRGAKTIEYRSRPVNIRDRIYIYAALGQGRPDAYESIGKEPGELPTGVLVGTVEIVGCQEGDGGYEWLLAKPKRVRTKLKPAKHPQPGLFYPF